MTEHLDSANQSIQNAIQGIFHIATGALALSVTFRSEIAPAAAKAKWILSIAWVLLALVPIAYVLLKLIEASQSIYWNNLHREMEEKIKNGVEVPLMKEIPANLQQLNRQADLCWRIMFISFLAGLFAFLVFGIINNGF